MILKMTPEAYLAREERAEYKSDYFQGELLAVAGSTRAHPGLAQALAEGGRGLLTTE